MFFWHNKTEITAEREVLLCAKKSKVKYVKTTVKTLSPKMCHKVPQQPVF